MFEKIFSDITSKVPEIRVIAIWGKDGLELERNHSDLIDGDNLEIVGAEIADLFSRLDSLKDTPTVFNLCFDSSGYKYIVSEISNEYFYFVLADSSAIPGRVNYYLDLNKDRIISSIS